MLATIRNRTNQYYTILKHFLNILKTFLLKSSREFMVHMYLKSQSNLLKPRTNVDSY